MIQEHEWFSEIDLFIFFRRNKYLPGDIMRGPEKCILSEQIQRSKQGISSVVQIQQTFPLC